MCSTYIISEFTYHRLVVAMGGEVKKFEASNNSLQSCLSFLERVQSQCVLPFCAEAYNHPPEGGHSNKLEHDTNDVLACLCLLGHKVKSKCNFVFLHLTRPEYLFSTGIRCCN